MTILDTIGRTRLVPLRHLVPNGSSRIWLKLETENPTGPYGAKGLGEMAQLGTSAAIANAVFDAVGVRIKSLPITPEKVLTALKEKESAGA